MKRVLCIRPVAMADVSRLPALAAGNAAGCQISGPFPRPESRGDSPEWHAAEVFPRASLAQVVVWRDEGWHDILLEVEPDRESYELPDVQQMQECWYELGQRYSPVVGWDNPAQPACMMLDLTKTMARLGDEARVLRALLIDFYRQGYLVRAALAATVGAAWAVANYGYFPTSDAVGGSVDGDGEVGQASSDVRYAIWLELATGELPVGALRVSSQVLELFQQLGLDRVSQLWRLPREALRSRFGDGLLVRMDQFVGKVDETIVAYEPPPRFEVRRAFEHPLQQQDAVEQAAVGLLAGLCEHLRQKQRGVIQLDCQWECGDLGNTVLRIGTYIPTSDLEHLARLLRMHLMTHRLPGPLHALRLSAATTTGLVAQQEALFQEMRDRQPRALADLIDRLSCRLGWERVVGVQLLAEPQIERSYRLVPLTGSRSKARAMSDAALRHHAWGIGQRPCRLLSPPVRLLVPTPVSHGPPASFGYRGRLHQVVHAWGPERLETGWWRGPTIRRDYYRVEDRQGRRFWIFHDLRRAVWFMHADSI